MVKEKKNYHSFFSLTVHLNEPVRVVSDSISSTASALRKNNDLLTIQLSKTNLTHTRLPLYDHSCMWHPQTRMWHPQTRMWHPQTRMWHKTT